MARYCANCGTEVDETAIFCPTCGQPIDQEVETAIPPAPAWPDAGERARREPGGEPTRPISDATRPPEPEPPGAWAPQEPEIRPTSERRIDAPTTPDRGGWDAPESASPPPATRSAEPPPAAPREDMQRPAPAAGDRPAGPPPRQPGPRPGAGPARTEEPAPSPLANMPVTVPVTLSGWLVGVGAALAAVGALISLFDGFGAAVDLLLAIALGAVAVTVFFSSSLPTFAQLRLTTFAIVLVAFGAGLDRLLTGARGVGELLLFMGTAAAVIGAIILELGRDQPLGGSS